MKSCLEIGSKTCFKPYLNFSQIEKILLLKIGNGASVLEFSSWTFRVPCSLHGVYMQYRVHWLQKRGYICPKGPCFRDHQTVPQLHHFGAVYFSPVWACSYATFTHIKPWTLFQWNSSRSFLLSAQFLINHWPSYTKKKAKTPPFYNLFIFFFKNSQGAV